MPQPGASLLSYRASIPLSNHTLTRLADLIRTQRAERCSRWRKLDPVRQALLVLAHLRNGDTYTRLAAGFSVGTTTAWRYVQESVELLAILADEVQAAAARAAWLAYAILDGTLIPIDRLADERPYCRVGTERGAGVATGPFLRAAHRTRRATLTAPGSPRSVPLRRGSRARGWGSCCPGSGSG
ncbi:hypothetical protein GCM10020219_046360 [Nonomuraea dietziae]